MDFTASGNIYGLSERLNPEAPWTNTAPYSPIYTPTHTQVTSREDCWSFHYFLLITVLQFLVFLSSVSIQLFSKKLNTNLLLLNNSKHFLLHQNKLCLILQNLLCMYYVLTCQSRTWCTAISKIIQNTVYLTNDMEMTHFISPSCFNHWSQIENKLGLLSK